jgi:hypothetical protein
LDNWWWLSSLIVICFLLAAENENLLLEWFLSYCCYLIVFQPLIVQLLWKRITAFRKSRIAFAPCMYYVLFSAIVWDKKFIENRKKTVMWNTRKLHNWHSLTGQLNSYHVCDAHSIYCLDVSWLHGFSLILYSLFNIVHSGSL